MRTTHEGKPAVLCACDGVKTSCPAGCTFCERKAGRAIENALYGQKNDIVERETNRKVTISEERSDNFER